MQKKKELVSFNEVVRDIPSLVELDDATLDQVTGGVGAGLGELNPSAAAEETTPGCNTLC
ncbi:MAG TPA: hypothetical protein VF815_13475 [Myxococcaceae bacterium]|jgi:hypothetical protein